MEPAMQRTQSSSAHLEMKHLLMKDSLYIVSIAVCRTCLCFIKKKKINIKTMKKKLRPASCVSSKLSVMSIESQQQMCVSGGGGVSHRCCSSSPTHHQTDFNACLCFFNTVPVECNSKSYRKLCGPMQLKRRPHGGSSTLAGR